MSSPTVARTAVILPTLLILVAVGNVVEVAGFSIRAGSGRQAPVRMGGCDCTVVARLQQARARTPVLHPNSCGANAARLLMVCKL